MPSATRASGGASAPNWGGPNVGGGTGGGGVGGGVGAGRPVAVGVGRTNAGVLVGPPDGIGGVGSGAVTQATPSGPQESAIVRPRPASRRRRPTRRPVPGEAPPSANATPPTSNQTANRQAII